MAIISDEKRAYTTDEHFYYLTEKAVQDDVINGEELITIWNNPERRLKLMGRLLHDEVIKSRYNINKERYRHRDFIEYRIFKNEYDEAEAIYQALIRFVEIVDDTELDRDILMGVAKFPSSVTQPLRDAGIIFHGEIIGEPIDEDEYRVGY